MLVLVSEFMSIRGLRHGLYSPGCQDAVIRERLRSQKSEFMRSARRRSPEVSRALTWLTVNVAPSIKRLSAAGLRGEVLQALDLDHEV